MRSCDACRLRSRREEKPTLRTIVSPNGQRASTLTTVKNADNGVIPTNEGQAHPRRLQKRWSWMIPAPSD